MNVKRRYYLILHVLVIAFLLMVVLIVAKNLFGGDKTVELKNMPSTTGTQ